MLGVLNETAAFSNDQLGLFASADRFPRVFAAKKEMEEAEAGLQGLLPELRKRLRLPRLDFVSVQNQGTYLIEVPVERKDVPKVHAPSLPLPS